MGSVDIGLVTCAEFPELSEDDNLLRAALHERGVSTEPVVWDDPAVDWSRFRLALLRSPWDYVAHRERFLAWARTVPTLANPADVVAWNTDKQYLDDLSAAGIDVVPTSWVRPGQDWDVPPSGTWVIKPSVAAGSVGAGRYDVTDPSHVDLARAHIARLHESGRTVMVQPYLDAVDAVGETALLFTADDRDDIRFSHAIRKDALLDGPDPGDGGLYRVSGTHPRVPGATERRIAEAVLDAVPGGRKRLLYARVDLIPGADGRFLLLELELTEPNLFFHTDAPAAAARMADALAARLR